MVSSYVHVMSVCTRVSHRIVSEMATDAAAPVERNFFNNLDADDIVRIFRKLLLIEILYPHYLQRRRDLRV